MKVRTRDFIFFGFLVLYGFSMIYLCFQLNIWVDEAYTLNTTSRNLPDVINQAYKFESQAPFYFVLLSIWRDLNSSIFFARLFSLLFVGLAAFVFSRIVRLISESGSTRWLLIIFLLNPFTVWAATEIRLYAFLLFLSTVCIYFFFRYFIENKNKHLYVFLVICLIGLYTQYFFAFLIAALSVSLLIFKGWKAWLKFCLYLIPVIILFLPNLLYIPEQMSIVRSQEFEFTFAQRFLNVFLYSPKTLIADLNIITSDANVRRAITLIFLAGAAYSYFVWYKKSRDQINPSFQRFNTLMISIISLLVMFSAFFAIGRIDFQDRYLTMIFPLLILVFVLFNVYPFLKRTLIFGSITIIYLSLLIVKYKSPVKKYDYKAITKYITQIEEKDEPLLFYHSAIALPFLYYYHGNNPVKPLPHALQYDSTFLAKVVDTFELKQSIASIKTNSKSYLLITDLAEEQYKDDENRIMVNGYLLKHYTVTFDTLYYGMNKEHPLRIRRLQVIEDQ